MQFSIQNLGLTVPGQQKAQGYFNSVGTSLGYGERHVPLDNQPVDNPGVGNYDIGKNAQENSNATWKFGTSIRKDKKRDDWPGPGDTTVPTFTTYGRKTQFPNQKLDKDELKKIRNAINAKDDTLGPGYYPIHKPSNGQIYSFGSRFDSSIRNKDHLKPKKVDGPGPGAYKLPGSVQVKNRHPTAISRTTFGTSAREFIDLPKDVPGPNRYRPVHFTEASHAYSIPHAPNQSEDKIAKQALLPGPHHYNNMQQMKDQKAYAKSMLGGSKEEKPVEDNGFPGPAAYQQNQIHPIPGFVIMQHITKTNRTDEDKKKIEKEIDVGPHSYNPFDPAKERTDKLVKNSIGNSLRQDMVARVKVPGPGKYIINGDFEKAQERPKFHMGIKTQSFMGKNLDMPGPGEYETDVIPIHHSNVAHFIGTSVRSDLGVGKAYMYPGPGEYEAQIDSQMDPRIRIAGTFGTQKKDTVVKKTFAPGPGSYDLPASCGLMPQYLRTEENRAAKQAQEAALRARLEI